ncbi:threonine dehydrogenase-like Zn-dependent dehydrogenase [Arthrobacter sp. PvP023]|uniref:zinc-dependent alcohol dehydrogenase n=1 Tax=Micrococcaceae TaxID=1268 RepID=UPI001AE9765F|nr:zinc-binding alcohol dehydrogenase [Arthrobacter sp. PvP023]MBP1137682.1 threonine dehydrogenase-like Zn-dependent dehydrogenase [Arthrobacter sp. PvP023]
MINSQQQSEHRPQARAYWTVGHEKGELRTEELPAPGPGDALVRALYSGISKGTETVVHCGKVPPRVAEQMRAPLQEGSFPSPVKFGYLSVGIVENGPEGWEGRTVFCLHPHQDRYIVPVESLTVVPENVPARRAVLTGTVETAVNALWEAGPRLGDRVAVVGAGLVGGMVATLLRTFPLQRLQLVDVDPAKRAFADALGVEFSHPDDALADCDIVFHCSASQEGLERSLQLVGDEGDVIEMSWYADRKVTIPLGEDFHARRLSIRASQVGIVARARRHRRTNADRLALAVSLLSDPVYDTFLTGESPFADLPAVVHALAEGRLDALCHVIEYPSEHPAEDKR